MSVRHIHRHTLDRKYLDIQIILKILLKTSGFFYILTSLINDDLTCISISNEEVFKKLFFVFLGFWGGGVGVLIFKLSLMKFTGPYITKLIGCVIIVNDSKKCKYF